ncbi:NAD-dependent epimerase/dehydratase family protein [Acetobacter sp. LMG 1636]|uniref:NAD-dependent epimerase/dehydratase family protein n=2 Tax=Acetobacter fallax TaxID=1737473 RepID=A0ABX0KDC6_9PROT|nr:NAD-dependent epimerase/dehydratase family protein [Acetobacter fallax]NHO36826.1 NAD-dependent epimerase/dehydratase family protein [Acetobacter fallax]
MRILVTGAQGFVGNHLLHALRSTSHNAQPDTVPNTVIEAARFDITDPDAVSAVLDRTRPDLCFHLAAISSIGAARADPDEAWTVNLHGTLRVANALRRINPGATFVFASSAEAYGDSFRSGLPLDETAPLAPANTYSATKAAADLALGALAHEDLRTIRLRPFNHTGPGQTADFVVPAFARQIARIEAGLQDPVLSVGNLDAERDFLDVRDICAAYLACARHAADIRPGTIFNLCSGQTRSIRSVVDDLIRLSGTSVTVRIAPEKLRPVDLPRAAGSAQQAAATLNWHPSTAWDDTLRAVLDDWRARIRHEA